jgi:HD-GYP domain-containing protein (c-di-GMP phosphodiesterase class II)
MMAKVVVEIAVEDLHIGLYVSRLDRPWSETPFVFQGFEIANDQDISQLRSLCKHVHVEITRDEAEEIRKISRARAGQAESVRPTDLAALLAGASRVARIKDPEPLKAELARARNIVDGARQAVTEIMDRLRRDARADVVLLDTVMDSMIDSVFRNRDALNWLGHMRRKDDYLYNHSISTSIWALAFGRHLGFDKPFLKVIGIGSMLLDIGKTRLDDELLKRQGQPSRDDWRQLHAHVRYGLEMVQDDPNLDPDVKKMIRTHHERLDGSGYPDGLKGDDIPLVGRIAGIVDCYDAMTSERSYAKAKSTYEAVGELKKLGGVAFPAELIDLFIQAVGVFPTGTLVELNTGEIGVVVAHNRFRRLRPEVMLLLDANKNLRDEFPVIDLQMRERETAEGDPALHIMRGLPVGAHGIDPTEYFL